MLVNLYDKQSARLLAMATVANATGPRSRSTGARARVIDIGGGWNTRSWRDSLRRLTDRGTVTALAVRTQPTQRHLTDAEWEQVARRLARHAGLGQQPWLAVRTSATTVAVLTDSTAGPPKMDDARQFIRSVTAGFGLTASGKLTDAADLQPRLTFEPPSAREEPTAVDPTDAPAHAVGRRDTAHKDNDVAEVVVTREELTDKGLIAAVSMQWERMAAMPNRGNRIEMAAGLAWNHTYSDAFQFGYNALAKAAADKFATMHQRLVDDSSRDPKVADCVGELPAIARGAMPWRIETPEVPRQTLMTATRAGLERPEDQTIPEAMVRAVCGEAAAIGSLKGAIAATDDIRQGWKASDRSLELAVIDDAALHRVDAVLTGLRSHLGEMLAARDGSAGSAPAAMRASFAAPPGAQTTPALPNASTAPVPFDKLRRNRY